MKAFTDSRRWFWLGGVVVLLAGLFAAFVLLPANSATPGAGGPEIQVPKMENVPPPNAPKLGIETGGE